MTRREQPAQGEPRSTGTDEFGTPYDQTQFPVDAANIGENKQAGTAVATSSGMSAEQWLRERGKSDERINEFLDTIGKLYYVGELCRDYAGELREERDALTLQLNNYKSACRDLSVTQVMAVFDRLEGAEAALAEARDKALDEAAELAWKMQREEGRSEIGNALLALKEKP